MSRKSKQLVRIIATGFGTGLLPVAPGSWGSVAILPVAALIHFFFAHQGLLIASMLLLIIGLIATKHYIQIYGRADPPEITIDEMAAQLFVLSAAQLNFISYLFAFLLFRLFDIFKPWPIPFLEKQLPPASAVMLDDFAAGIYAMIFLGIFSFIGLI